MIGNVGDGWSDERVEKLKAMAITGASAGQIAKELGDVSRNAVIGKIHRLKVVRPQAPSAPKIRAVKAPSVPRAPGQNNGLNMQSRKFGPASGAAPTIKSAPLPAERDAPGSATIHTLAAHMCKWPIGDPKADNFTFCGAHKRDDAGPYCPAHAKRAYAPAMPPRKAKRA